MTYEQTVDYLFNRLPNYQKQGKSAYKADLSNITSLCKILGNPQDRIKTIHVAGTNGKGSTCHMLSSVFQEAGYKVGLFTSPHLIDFRERVKINGMMIPKETVVSFVNEFQAKFEEIEPSFFEWTTSLAFYYFAQQDVDIAIIETGLGGRLDSTNIILPELSIITSISIDHANILGNTIEKIAIEKSGIIKNNTPVVVGDKNKDLTPVFIAKANEKNAPLYFSESNPNHSTDLLGDYQKQNINTAVTSLNVLKTRWNLSEENIKNGLSNVIKNTNLRGRWEIISIHPKIICDVGHNEAGVKKIINQLAREKYTQLHIVWGMANDKNTNEILALLPSSAKYYFCAAKSNRALSTDILLDSATKNGLKGNTYTSVNEALENAKQNATSSDIIFIGGSTFTVAEILF